MSFFITPIIILSLGVKNYGIYILIVTLIGFVNLIDFGLSTAILKFLSEADNHHNQTKTKDIINPLKQWRETLDSIKSSTESIMTVNVDDKALKGLIDKQKDSIILFKDSQIDLFKQKDLELGLNLWEAYQSNRQNKLKQLND
jgi:hypothetical protein